MKKRIVSLALCVCLLAVAAMGTIAYFTDTEQITNTMVIGNVQINVDEYQKNEQGEYETFVDDDFVLYPLENEQGVQLRNKVVYTTNTSPSKDDAYIRTIVLLEKNDLLTNSHVNEGGNCCVPGLHFSHFGVGEAQTSVITGKMVHGSKAENVGEATIGGEDYWVIVLEEEHEEAIPYDETLYSLSAVHMDKNITTEQIAGWGEDKKVDIIVFSQGIQTEGLTYDEAMAALGEVNQTNLTSWIGADDAVING